MLVNSHPYYGCMALNLACSIKSVEPDTQIAIVHDDIALTHLTGAQRSTFTHLIPLPPEYRTGFGVKLHLDQLTPFDRTLYLDVDMLWLSKKPSELFAGLSGFNIITEGDSNSPNNKYYFWADPQEIKREYGVEKVWQTRSEVIYFERDCKVFNMARALKPETRLKTIRMFGTWIPDELYFNIAMAVTGIDPQTPKWMPAYWARLHGEVMPNSRDYYRDYYLLSFGSNAASGIMKRAYDTVMKVVSNKLKIPYMFKLKSKKEWAPDRLKI